MVQWFRYASSFFGGLFVFAHDVADASAGRGDASPFRGGLDLPGAVAFAAVASGRAHVAGDWIRTLRLGMLDHPVVGGAGNARYPALRRYRAAGGVGPYHACLRANTGAACSETSTSTSNRRSHLLSSTGSFCSDVRLSAARVEPLSRMPWTQRCRVDRAMSCPALTSRDGLPLPLRLHDLPFERLAVVTGMFRVGHRRPPIPHHSSLIGLSNTL